MKIIYPAVCKEAGKDFVIYAITHTQTGRVYVGSTCNLKQRWAHHAAVNSAVPRKGQGTPTDSPYRQAWQCDGQQGFILTILEKIDDPGFMLEREDYWIRKLDTLHPNGFNMTPVIGLKQTQERLKREMNEILDALSGEATPKQIGLIMQARERLKQLK